MTELEKAAKEELLHSYATIVDGELAYQRQAMLTMFRKGAEWQSKQSPWISVEERLPETDDGQSLYEVIVITDDKSLLVVINTEVQHLVGLCGVTHWMPTPKLP